MSALIILCRLAFVMLLTVFSCTFGLDNTMSLHSSKPGKGREDEKMARETCLNAAGVPFVKQFANSDNCNTFWFCTEISPGIPVALEYVCPLYYDPQDGQVKLLAWNFMTCQCDYPWKTTCYDQFDRRHTNYRYNCATPLSLSVV